MTSEEEAPQEIDAMVRAVGWSVQESLTSPPSERADMLRTNPLFGKKSSVTIVIASTEGGVCLPERDKKAGLNVYRKRP